MFPSPVVSVNWTIAQPIEVTEGYKVEVRLRAQAFGLYENPIEIGVVCAAATSTGVESGMCTQHLLTLASWFIYCMIVV